MKVGKLGIALALVIGLPVLFGACDFFGGLFNPLIGSWGSTGSTGSYELTIHATGRYEETVSVTSPAYEAEYRGTWTTLGSTLTLVQDYAEQNGVEKDASSYVTDVYEYELNDANDELTLTMGDLVFVRERW